MLSMKTTQPSGHNATPAISDSERGMDATDTAPPCAPKDGQWVEHHMASMLVGALAFVVCYFGFAAAALAH